MYSCQKTYTKDNIPTHKLSCAPESHLRKPYFCVTVLAVDAETQKKLDRILQLSEENNAYIKKVRSAQKSSLIWKAIYWIIIIVFTVGGFYAVKPYLSTMSSLYGNTGTKGFQLPDSKQLQELIDQYKGAQK